MEYINALENMPLYRIMRMTTNSNQYINKPLGNLRAGLRNL